MVSESIWNIGVIYDKKIFFLSFLRKFREKKDWLFKMKFSSLTNSNMLNSRKNIVCLK